VTGSPWLKKTCVCIATGVAHSERRVESVVFGDPVLKRCFEVVSEFGAELAEAGDDALVVEATSAWRLAVWVAHCGFLLVGGVAVPVEGFAFGGPGAG